MRILKGRLPFKQGSDDHSHSLVTMKLTRAIKLDYDPQFSRDRDSIFFQQRLQALMYFAPDAYGTPIMASSPFTRSIRLSQSFWVIN